MNSFKVLLFVLLSFHCKNHTCEALCPPSHLVVQVIQLQSRVMASVEGLHCFAAADGQGQCEYGEPQHHERHHAAFQCPPCCHRRFSSANT